MSIPSPDFYDDWQGWASAVKQELEKQVSYAPKEKTGKIATFKADAVLDGYLVCDGSTFSSGSFPALYQLLGTNVLPNFTSALAGCVVGIKT